MKNSFKYKTEITNDKISVFQKRKDGYFWLGIHSESKLLQLIGKRNFKRFKQGKNKFTIYRK